MTFTSLQVLVATVALGLPVPTMLAAATQVNGRSAEVSFCEGVLVEAGRSHDAPPEAPISAVDRRKRACLLAVAEKRCLDSHLPPELRTRVLLALSEAPTASADQKAAFIERANTILEIEAPFAKERIAALTAMSGQLFRRKQYAESRKLLEETLGLRRSHFGEQGFMEGRALLVFAYLAEADVPHMRAENIEKAQREADALLNEATARLQPSAPAFVPVLQAQSAVLRARGLFDEADDLAAEYRLAERQNELDKLQEAERPPCQGSWCDLCP